MILDNNTRKIVLRQDLMDICEEAPKPQVAAVVLNSFIYWTSWKINHNKLIRSENEIYELAGRSQDMKHPELDGLWVFKSYDQLYEECMGLFGKTTIQANIKWLVKTKFLERRKNPKLDWDKTYQYRVNIPKIKELLFKWGADDVPEKTHNSSNDNVPNSIQDQASTDNAKVSCPIIQIQQIDVLDSTDRSVGFNTAIPNKLSNKQSKEKEVAMPDSASQNPVRDTSPEDTKQKQKTDKIKRDEIAPYFEAIQKAYESNGRWNPIRSFRNHVNKVAKSFALAAREDDRIDPGIIMSCYKKVHEFGWQKAGFTPEALTKALPHVLADIHSVADDCFVVNLPNGDKKRIPKGEYAEWYEKEGKDIFEQANQDTTNPSPTKQSNWVKFMDKVGIYFVDVEGIEKLAFQVNYANYNPQDYGPFEKAAIVPYFLTEDRQSATDKIFGRGAYAD